MFKAGAFMQAALLKRWPIQQVWLYFWLVDTYFTTGFPSNFEKPKHTVQLD